MGVLATALLIGMVAASKRMPLASSAQFPAKSGSGFESTCSEAYFTIA